MRTDVPLKAHRRSHWKGALAVACLAVGALLALTPYAARPDAASASTPTVASAPAEPKLESVPIRSVRLGQRVEGKNPLREQVDPAIEPDPATWREIRLRMNKYDGGELTIELLRDLDWIDLTRAEVGESIWLDLPELGAEGDAEVTYIGACPEIEAEDPEHHRPIVTGRFIHDSANNLVALTLEGELFPTRVTDSHPYWSVDRKAFIPAGELKTGERLDAIAGEARVASVSRLATQAQVFNLEVGGEHVYRVGTAATLVHNLCQYKVFQDGLGRTRSAIARITRADIGTGTSTTVASRAASRALGNSTDDAGHLIGNLLGGPGGKRAANFFAQNPHINRGAFAQFEQRVARLVEQGNHVIVRVSLRYNGNSTRASDVLYQVRVNGTTALSQLFSN